VLHPVTFAAFREIPWNLFGNLAAGRSQVLFRTPYLDNAIVELAYRAPRQARVSPLPALRFVARNHRALSRIPTDRGLVGAAPGVLGHLRHGCAQLGFKVEYHTNEGLPDWLAPVEGVVRHVNVAAQFRGWHKFLHYRRWLRRELADALREQLADAVRLAQPFWNMEFIGHMAEDHIQGRKNLVRELDVVLTLAAVERRLFRPVSHSN
jgi:asparagine synthase (glutamine-hydrolysing)